MLNLGIKPQHFLHRLTTLFYNPFSYLPKIILNHLISATYSRKKLITYRRDSIGFVFQFYNLVQNLTALENIELAIQICKNPLDPKTILEKVGLGDRINNFPAQLSGGEQQRVAIAGCSDSEGFWEDWESHLRRPDLIWRLPVDDFQPERADRAEHR